MSLRGELLRAPLSLNCSVIQREIKSSDEAIQKRDCFTELALNEVNVFAMTTRECHCEKQSDEAIPDEFVGDNFAIATGNYQVKKYRRI